MIFDSGHNILYAVPQTKTIKNDKVVQEDMHCVVPNTQNGFKKMRHWDPTLT